MKIEINITPMSMKNGVLGLPIACCRDWDASKSVEGVLEYANRKSNITFSPKHIDFSKNIATAWQFTVNDSVQFGQLKMDGVYTYIEEKVSGEKLVCDFYEEAGNYVLKVIEVVNEPETNATKKIKEFLKQGLREESQVISKAPLWNSPSEWIEFDRINDYSEVQDCLYIWTGSRADADTVYLYVGIVGDTKSQGRSKRNLAQRLKEEQKKFMNECGVNIKQFRFCSLNNAEGYSVPELLKTVEMAEITIMTSLFRCDNARDNIDALFENHDVILLNKMTSYKYVK
jgi:hypothetical protein